MRAYSLKGHREVRAYPSMQNKVNTVENTLKKSFTLALRISSSPELHVCGRTPEHKEKNDMKNCEHHPGDVGPMIGGPM